MAGFMTKGSDMGLTIHYGIRSRTTSDDRARRLVEQMRQLALDLPFEQVSDVVTLEGNQCDVEAQRGKVDDASFWLIIQSGQSVRCPWNPDIHLNVTPTRIVAFQVCPGPGSEPANIGLCQYPKEIEFEYQPENDRRFHAKTHPYGPGSTRWEFSWRKWNRWQRKNGHDPYAMSPTQETRKVKTRLGGWRWSSFCKTQYASDPCCGGVANFLRCHISVVTLLERIAELPTVKVELDDEGQYGRSYYTDDPWAEERVYTWHEGKYDPKALAEAVGDWNEMIAAQVGALNDMAKASGVEGVSAIQGFPNFEHLEFKGAQQEHLQPFLEAMRKLAEQERTRHVA